MDPMLRLADAWSDAALSDRDWRGPLRDSANLAGAKSLVLLQDGPSGSILSAAPEADPAFMRLCMKLAREKTAGPLEHYEAGLGWVRWLTASEEPGRGVALGALFAVQDAGAALLDAWPFIAKRVFAGARLARQELLSSLKTAALDRLPVGAAIVDHGLRILECNEAGKDVLKRQDGLSSVCGRLRCRLPGDQRSLIASMREVQGGAIGERVVTVARARRLPAYVVRLLVAPGPAECCLLLVVDPDAAPTLNAETWRSMFDLTECELAIAKGLLSGKRVSEIASDRGVSKETVRTQLKAVFSRLNVSGQSQAVARLSRTSPFRAAARPHVRG